MRFKFHSSFLWSDNRHNNHTWSLETPTGHVLIPGVKHNTQSSHEWLVRAQCVCSAPGVTGALPGLRSMLASDIHLKNDGHIYITMWCHCPCSAFFCLQLPFCEAVVIVSNCSMTTYALQFFNDLSTAPPPPVGRLILCPSLSVLTLCWTAVGSRAQASIQDRVRAATVQDTGDVWRGRGRAGVGCGSNICLVGGACLVQKKKRKFDHNKATITW